MKKTLLASFLLAFLTLGNQAVFASSDIERQDNQNDHQDSKNSSEKSNVTETDSTQIGIDAVFSRPGEQSEQVETLPPRLRPEQAKPTEQEAPAEDQSKTPVSSFNFLYYLIEKIKFPDLLDESF